MCQTLKKDEAEKKGEEEDEDKSAEMIYVCIYLSSNNECCEMRLQSDQNPQIDVEPTHQD